LGAFCHILAYSTLAQGLPYPYFLCGITIGGFALALQDAQVNNIGCRLRNGSRKLSIVQACFSIGGTIAPFFATPFVGRFGSRPYLYFYISMGVAIFAFGIMGLAFVRGGIEDIVRGPKTMEPYAEIEDGSIGVVTTKGREEGDHSWGKIKRLLTNPLILALMMWSFFYVSHACLTEAELTDRPEQNRALADTWYV
jgi:MFS family permease